MEQRRLIISALLGDHEAAKRLTDAGVLVPCPGCGGDNIVDWYRHNEVWYQCDDCGWEGPSVYSEGFADTEQARLSWNTRAPILSESEMLTAIGCLWNIPLSVIAMRTLWRSSRAIPRSRTNSMQPFL